MLKSKTQKELVNLSKSIVQPLLTHYYKGQSGKIAVIGGCEDYTGAPFFAGHSAALIGCDLSHVICERRASPVIKLYLPDLMVHPYLVESNNYSELSDYMTIEELRKINSMSVDDVIRPEFKLLDKVIEEMIMPKVMAVINRVDVIVLGPGFGRDSLMMKSLYKIIEQIKVMNKPMIIDADALYLVSRAPHLVKNYAKAVLTPNLVEFERIGTAVGVDSIIKETDSTKILHTTMDLSKKLGNITIVRKGQHELIINGDEYLVNEMEGSNKRVGGQGDTLTGCLATYLTWADHYQNEYWDIDKANKLTKQELTLLACFAASGTVRLASRKAYRKHGRSLQTSHVHECLGEAYSEMFDNEDFVKL